MLLYAFVLCAFKCCAMWDKCYILGLNVTFMHVSVADSLLPNSKKWPDMRMKTTCQTLVSDGSNTSA